MTLEAAFSGRLGAFSLDAALAAPARGVTAIFGPSGCGKTTLLRAIAGLTRLEGRLSLNGEVWQDGATFRPVHRRPIGYVFQEASLFPHLNVRANLDYGRRRALRGGAAEAVRFDEAVELLGLAALLDRGPQALSGGERQRVAIGRALLSQPRLLLMDEPLAALDRMARDEILPYLDRLRDGLGLPILYVSHDIAEVERLAGHMVLMRAGRVVAQGPMADLAADPRLPLARMPEDAVTLTGQVVDRDAAHDIARIAVPGAEILVPGLDAPVGSRQRLRVAAQDVSVAVGAPGRSSILNLLPARLIAMEAEGPAAILILALGEAGEGARLIARITRLSAERLGLIPGQVLLAQVKAVRLERHQQMEEAPSA